jgi:hypothetical protein
MVVQLAPKIAAASAVDFGSVITGATAEQPFQVQNSATAPADELNYSFASVPAGFTAPAGGFVAGVSVPGNHVLGMDTAAPGAKSGTLTLATDAPDSLSKPVQLAGTVLAHAAPSLDSLVAATEDTLDFGSHAEGGFPDLDARAHNRGWNALRARLHVSAGAITGGAGRFSIVGGFTPALIAGTGASWAVRFDAAGATPDSTYEGTLTLSTADEALPGATALDDLVVRLVARTAPGTNSVPGLPATLRFHAPRPNPASREAAFAFDLPRDEDVALEVFDLAGRRVATLAAGRRGAGSHSLRWRMTDASGARLGAGLYFARFRAGAYRAIERLVVLP